ncbi:MAG TPA: hypothetical protein VEC11_08505 [Allosphingosinicella sp.]|nr:hypothetical protein [Allosphingosinicella sp.]
MKLFAQDEKSGTTTLSELVRIYGELSPPTFFGCYAYATQSGFRAFELAMGDDFWSSTTSHWLFGIDYGRTDPRALREIADRQNADIRIYDGAWVVKQDGFMPRRDFHAKLAIMEDAEAPACGIVLGSGNFSFNGLRRSVEAGTAIIASAKEEIEERTDPLKNAFEILWNNSTPLQTIISDYEDRRAALLSKSDAMKPKKVPKAANMFWIEAGYVTKNRGKHAPGNQIFFPKGFRGFFGFPNKANEQKNSVIGSVTFATKIGPDVTNDLRLNRNSMEKISLPIPETHGFGVYDGKVLVFERRGGKFFMSAFESAEFELVFSHRLVAIKRMNGGRRYGEIV